MKFATAMAFTPPDQYRPLAEASEEAGIWAVSCSDHLVHPQELRSPYPYSADGSPRFKPFTPWLDPWVAIATMAAVTSKLRFFTNIYVLPLRNVLTVAKTVGTAAVMSNDRVALGIGVGWMEEEFEMAGQAFARRGKRNDEMMEILRGLWAADGTYFSYEGEFHSLPAIEMSPAPAQPIPIYVGGISEIAFKRAARIGDGWISDLMSTDQLEESIARINYWRGEFGTLDRPFEFVASSSDASDLAGFRRVEAAGVTCLLTLPWVFTHGFTEDLDRRVAGTLEFGRNIIEPLRAEAS